MFPFIYLLSLTAIKINCDPEEAIYGYRFIQHSLAINPWKWRKIVIDLTENNDWETVQYLGTEQAVVTKPAMGVLLQTFSFEDISLLLMSKKIAY